MRMSKRRGFVEPTALRAAWWSRRVARRPHLGHRTNPGGAKSLCIRQHNRHIACSCAGMYRSGIGLPSERYSKHGRSGIPNKASHQVPIGIVDI
jgi:hypothetical protein